MEQKLNIGEEVLNIKNDNFDMNVDNGSISINPIRKDNYTLDDLRQKLINYFYENSPCMLSNGEAEILKELLKK